MKKMLNNGELFVWMQLLGLDREQADYGVGQWLSTMGSKPDGVCLFTPHPDIIHEHSGMDKEVTLHPDDCAYGAIPANIVRARQAWTNYDLRGAVAAIRKAGVSPYLSIQGAFYNNMFHKEWVMDHPQVRHHLADGTISGVHPLKRFADGTYYEDFFIEKLCQALVDYDLDGIQLADALCPSGSTHNGDASTDMMEQFFAHSGITPPADILATMGDDSAPALTLRRDWRWKAVRAEWIEFYNWRWEVFFKKVCAAVHALGKKVIALAVYCTDPFETMYCLGVDLKRIVNAGVDYLMPNTLPTSVHFNGRAERFWRYMSTIPLIAAHIGGTNQLCMLGVKDSTEEWDALQDAPCQFQRDMYTILGQQYITDKGCERAAGGLMICLGDAIEEEEWAYMQKHFAGACTNDIEKVLTPTVVCSDAGFYNTLRPVCETGRWSTHKFVYEAAKKGAPCYGAVRIENIDCASGTLFVPNFDLLPEAEQKCVCAHTGGPVVATAAADFDLSALGAEVTVTIADTQAKCPTKAFAFGANFSAEAYEILQQKLTSPNVEPEPEYGIDEKPNWGNTLEDTIPFIKLSSGFLEGLAYLLYHINDENMPFVCTCRPGPILQACDCPYTMLKLKNGKYRLFLYNPSGERYRRVSVVTKYKKIIDAHVVSFYPLLPVKYNSAGNAVDYIHKYEQAEDAGYMDFMTKIRPNGITVVDVELA